MIYSSIDYLCIYVYFLWFVKLIALELKRTSFLPILVGVKKQA